MLKWKHACLLNNKPLDTIRWKSEKGFTLVELLASIALLSVVILLAGSVHIFGQRQFIAQTESASQANDMSYALSVMSRDLRKEAGGTVEVTENGTEIVTDSGLLFKYSDNKLKKNESILIDSVSSMKAIKEDNSIKIILRSTSPGIRNKTYQTTIYFRR